MLKKITTKNIIKILAINAIIYFSICLVLIYWPIPKKKDFNNYNYSSIKKIVKDTTETEKLWIKMRDSSQLFNRLYPSKSKNVLILIHGSGTESRYLKTLAKAMADSNIATVLTPDIRGHGENQGKRGDIDYIGQLENDVEDLISYSKNNLGANKIFLAGHSSGGGFVLRYIGNSQNTKVDKAIMLSPFLGHKAPTYKPNAGEWVTVVIKRWAGISMLNSLGIKYFNDKPVLIFNRPKNNNNLQISAYSYRMAVNFAPENYEKEIANIKIPCLVLVGGKDESFYPEKFEGVFEPAKKLVKTEVLREENHLGIVNSATSFSNIINWIKD